MMDQKIDKIVYNTLFTAKEFESLVFNTDIPVSEAEITINKVLQLDDGMIFTKAIFVERILNNNPCLKESKSSLILKAYNIQEVARNKVMSVLKKLYKNEYFIDYTYKEIMRLFILKMQDLGVEVQKDGLLLLTDIVENNENLYIQFHTTFLDSIVQLCNSKNTEKYVNELLEYEDETLNHVIFMLTGISK